MQQVKDHNEYKKKVEFEELIIRKAEEEERKRLIEMERMLIDELKAKLMSILNEKSKLSDMRENDVKEIENID